MALTTWVLLVVIAYKPILHIFFNLGSVGYIYLFVTLHWLSLYINKYWTHLTTWGLVLARVI